MARLINPDGTEKEVDVNSLSFDEVADLLGKDTLIEYHYLSNGQLMLLDEDGKLKNQPRNTTATELASYAIVGSVLLLTPDESEQWDADVDDFDDDAEYEEDFLDDFDDEDEEDDDEDDWWDEDDEDEEDI